LAVSYEIVTGAGRQRARRYTSEDPLAPGEVVELGGRYRLVVNVDEPRVDTVAARYRLVLRHPDGREEAGALRRYHAESPTIGHQLTTREDGGPVSWTVVEQRLADDGGEPFLESIAERDYAEAESDSRRHEREHVLQRLPDDGDAAAATLARAEAAGLSVELVSLEAGEAPDWDEASGFLDAMVLDEVGDDLLELCGVDPDTDPQHTWLATVKERLGEDLESFRTSVEQHRADIEQWDVDGGRIFAAVGSADEESNPLSGYGRLCRLVDADVLGAAGFRRVRKALLLS
jgi:hypothetical protein